MANGKDNLIPMNERTKDEQREIARAGGIASGEARRRKRTLRQIAEILAERKINMPLPGGGTEEMMYDMALMLSMYKKAITKGDTKAAKFIATLLGEYTEKHEVEAKGTDGAPLMGQEIDINKLSDEQRKLLLSIGETVLNEKEN